LLKPRLVAMSGPLQGTVRAITDDPLCLGRNAANQVMIGDSAVSRKHCTISQISQGVYEAQPLPAFRLAFAAPLGHVNVNHRLPEAIAVQGTFYFGGNFFL
jgi:hypothetical protein